MPDDYMEYLFRKAAGIKMKPPEYNPEDTEEDDE